METTNDHDAGNSIGDHGQNLDKDLDRQQNLPLQQKYNFDGKDVSQTSQNLKVIVVGGGIGGLSAALLLRKQGHHVEIYESSGFSKEIGAALNTCPNANAVLKHLGISCRGIGACVAERMSEWAYTGAKIKELDILTHHRIHAHKYRLAHRVKLHEALRKAATETDGVGQPANLRLSTSVQDVDTANAIVYFKDGSSVQGDVVIGADGIHSVTRTKLPGGDIQPFPSGLSAFRFLIPREAILSDPRTVKFADEDGTFNGIFAPDRSIITYPTNDNTTMNFVCIHPESESLATDGWGSNTPVSRLLDVYKDFHPDMLALLGKADEASLKVWKLLDMAELPNWHHERLAVLGDAAHPFLPFLGQGAAIAIEDAVSLGIVLERGLNKSEVPERLALYQNIRKERAELVQHYTRLNGKARGEKSAFDAARYQAYCFGHDEWDYSHQKLREWKWARLAKSSYPIATIFGPILRPVISAAEPTFTLASIKFNTSRTILDGMLPPGNKAFKFKSPGSIAQCTVRQTSIHGIPSLKGRAYKRLGFYFHGVQYTDAAGVKSNGAFLPIMFENIVGTNITDRAILETPTSWSTIDCESDTTSYRIRTGWEGSTWGEFHLDGLELVTPSTPALAKNPLPDASQTDEGTILHVYSPQTETTESGSQQAQESTEFVASDSDSVTAASSIVKRELRAKSASFTLDAKDWNAFPTLHHIISRLQEVTILSVIEAKVSEGSGMPELL